MITLKQASELTRNAAFPAGTERIPFGLSVGRILAEDIFSDIDMPPFDKSAVDGYACRRADLAENPGNLFLEVIETIPAGTIPQKSLSEGQCSKIMTGSKVPAGADCVVMVEDTELIDPIKVRINRYSNASNICFRAEDLNRGDRVIKSGTLLKPSHIAVLASVGVVNPLVSINPAVGVLSTGDEIVEPDQTPNPVQIRNSNSYQLIAQAEQMSIRADYLGIAADQAGSLHSKINQALDQYDVVLITGGVSMGDFDLVPRIMVESGVEILFKSVAIQPGRPTVFGRRGNHYIFGLPGNPVSSYILFEVLVKPFLFKLMGHELEPMLLNLPIGEDYRRKKPERLSMIPVRICDGAVFPIEYHGSAHINAYTLAHGVMMVEVGMTEIKKGELVHVRPI